MPEIPESPTRAEGYGAWNERDTIDANVSRSFQAPYPGAADGETPSVDRWRARARRAEFWFVVFVWFATSCAACFFAARYVSVLPFTDDVAMAPTLAAEEPYAWSLLWAPNNEHRFPVSKIVYVLLTRGTHDLRTGAWVQAGLLAAASLAVLLALRRRRGHLEFTDAVIPLLVNDLGNTENLLNSFQLAFSIPMLLVLALVTLALAWRAPPRWPGLACVWTSLVALVGCGGMGLVYAFAFAVWPLTLGFGAWRERRAGWRASSFVTLAGAAALAGAGLVYANDVVLLPDFQPPTFARFAAVLGQFSIVGIGVPSALHWPWSLALLVPVAVAVGSLARGLREVRVRGTALPIACALVGGAGLACVVAWGRGNDGPLVGFTNRYELLGAIPLCVAQLALRTSADTLAARLARFGLFAAVAASVAPNVEYAANVGRERAAITRDFLERARGGAGVEELARDLYVSFFYSPEMFSDCLHTFQQGGYLSELPLGERCAAEDAPLAARRLRPRGAAALDPVQVRLVEARPTYVARGPTSLEFEIPAGKVRAHGGVGVAACGVAGVVPCVVEVSTQGGRVHALAQLELTPSHAQEGIAWQTFDVELPADTTSAGPATLRVRFEPPAEFAARGWNVATGLGFVAGP